MATVSEEESKYDVSHNSIDGHGFCAKRVYGNSLETALRNLTSQCPLIRLIKLFSLRLNTHTHTNV